MEDRPLKKLQDEIRFAEDHGTHPEKASSTDSKPGQTEDGKLTGDEVKEQEAGKDEVHQALLKNDDRELDRVDMVRLIPPGISLLDSLSGLTLCLRLWGRC